MNLCFAVSTCVPGWSEAIGRVLWEKTTHGMSIDSCAAALVSLGTLTWGKCSLNGRGVPEERSSVQPRESDAAGLMACDAVEKGIVWGGHTGQFGCHLALVEI